MTILYINQEHCTSMEQLRSYFNDPLSYDSPIFYDLLDYARSGDMSRWLREKGNPDLAYKVDGIDENLGDSEYYSRLSSLMTGKENACDAFEKPDFSNCFQVEEVHQEKISDSMEIQVRLMVLSSVNESYEFSVRTSWGQKGDTINPYHEEKDRILTKSYFFRKRPNIDFKIVAFLVDGEELKDIQCGGLGTDTLEFKGEACDNTNNSIKSLEKRYRWQTDSFYRIIENDRIKYEEEQKRIQESMDREKERIEREKERIEREIMLERCRRKAEKKKEKRRNYT